MKFRLREYACAVGAAALINSFLVSTISRATQPVCSARGHHDVRSPLLDRTLISGDGPSRSSIVPLHESPRTRSIDRVPVLPQSNRDVAIGKPAMQSVTPSEQPDGDLGMGTPVAINLLYHSDVEPELWRLDSDQPSVESTVKLLLQSTRQFSVDITTSEGREPIDYSTELFEPASDAQRLRDWENRVVSWAPSGLFHQPLYFEDVPLERYGQGAGDAVQPFISGTRFLTNFASLPYQIGVDGVHDRVYALGYHRPGSPTPLIHQRLPWEADAAALQVATVLGLVFVLP